MKNKIQIFEDKKVRTVWDEDTEEWYFSVIDVYFDKNNQGVERVVMRENNGDVTDIEFVNRKLNQTIPDSKFTTKS